MRLWPVSASLVIVACGADGTTPVPVKPTARISAVRSAPPVSAVQPEIRWSGRVDESWISIDSMKTYLDLATIPVGIRTVKPEVLACGTRSTAKGKVQIRLKVSPDGRVASATVKSTPNPALAACVAAAMANAVFPRTDLGGTFTYPFAF